MKSISKILVLFLGMYVFTACEKILDKEPLDMITDAAVWGDEVLIDAYLTQTYSETHVFANETWGTTQWDNSDNSAAPALVNELTDECKNNWWTAPGYGNKFGNLSINGGLLEWWENAYRVIRALNIFIDRVPTSPVSEGFRTQRIAEARFLRAFNYFSMVKRYGGVPLILKAQATDDPYDELYRKRDTEQTVYDFVIAECDAILGDLSETVGASDYGRPTRYAALALKSRAALYAGSIAQFGSVRLNGLVGIDASRADAYYQTAYTAAAEIIAGQKHALYNRSANKVANFRSLFLEKNNEEVIFAKKYDYTDQAAGGNGWVWDFLQTPPSNVWGAGNSSGPYLEMVEEFEYVDGTSGKLDRNQIRQGLWTTAALWANKDPRFFASIYTQNTAWKSGVVDVHNGILLPDGSIQLDGSYGGILARGLQLLPAYTNPTGFGVLKYMNENHDVMGATGNSGTDWIVFRFGEVLLNYAEAADALGKSGDALWAINQIRNRAGIAEVAAVDRDRIRHERKVELAFEGHRYWDVRRWRTATTELSRDFSGLRYILDAATGNYKLEIINQIDGTSSLPRFYDRNYYLPITLGRTGNNPNLVENPGYE